MIFILLFILIVLYIYLLKNSKELCGNIAHACGLINSTKYTNSIEAFYNSYRKGYRKIEIDMLVTKDNHIVGAHDWDLFKILTNYKKNENLNYSYLVKAKILNKYNIIYDYIIYNLLKRFTDVIIVTDKIANYKLLKLFSKYTNRLYVFVESFQQYNLSKKYGFRKVLLNINTIYSLQNVFSFLSTGNSLFGITIGANLLHSCKSQLIKLFKMNIHIYVSDDYNITERKLAYCNYVSGFYID